MQPLPLHTNCAGISEDAARCADKLSRRRLLVAGAGAASCRRRGEIFFGTTEHRSKSRLVYLLGAEADSLDPAMFAGGYEGYILPALFEGLTSYHPQTLRPMAAMATHLELGFDPPWITCYLRGNPHPRGQALPNTTTLRSEFAQGLLAEDFVRGALSPPDGVPAHWSDGTVVTAHDFVFAWRRVADPRTAAPLAYWLFPIVNGEAVQAGKVPPDQLGVRALDDFTFQIDLRSAPQAFVRLLSIPTFAAVPKHAADDRQTWADPENLVTNGAFVVASRSPFDRTILRRNSGYYESDLVRLEELEFLPISDGTTTANLYRAGAADAMPGERLNPLLNVAIEGCRDYHVAPAFFNIWHSLNIRKPPFDNVLLRYALNMATDKEAIARCFGSGRRPARTLIPHIEGYRSPESLPVEVNGSVYDVLSYDPPRARELMAQAGYPGGYGPDGHPLRFTVVFPTLPHSRPIFEMLDRQWRTNLNVEPIPELQEFNVWMQTILGVKYPAVAEAGGWPYYLDPAGFIEWFANGSGDNACGYSDPALDAMLAEADGTTDPALRMDRLRSCELHILKAMPMIPVVHNVWRYLQKPYVRGMTGNALDKHPFKYAWIDTNWRAR